MRTKTGRVQFSVLVAATTVCTCTVPLVHKLTKQHCISVAHYSYWSSDTTKSNGSARQAYDACQLHDVPYHRVDTEALTIEKIHIYSLESFISNRLTKLWTQKKVKKERLYSCHLTLETVVIKAGYKYTVQFGYTCLHSWKIRASAVPKSNIGLLWMQTFRGTRFCQGSAVVENTWVGGDRDGIWKRQWGSHVRRTDGLMDWRHIGLESGRLVEGVSGRSLGWNKARFFFQTAGLVLACGNATGAESGLCHWRTSSDLDLLTCFVCSVRKSFPLHS